MVTIYSVITGLPLRRADGSEFTTSLACAFAIVARNPWLFFYEPSDCEVAA